MLTVVLCTALASSSVWFIIASILVSHTKSRYQIVARKHAGDLVLFKSSSGLIKPGVLAADWMPNDKYVILEGLKQNYVPYVVRANTVQLD
jgi:hypothetical protein